MTIPEILAATVPDREWTTTTADIFMEQVTCYTGTRANAQPIRVYFNGLTWFGGWQTHPDFWCDIGSPSPAYAAAVADVGEQQIMAVRWRPLEDV